MMQLIEAMAEYMIPGLGSHLGRVGRSSALVAEAMNIEESQVIGQAGFYHDIGKLTWPEHIRRGAPKTNQDREIIYSHPVVGADILSSSEGLQQLAPLVRHHHERYDGAGLPDNLIGEDIPLGSRIISVCDTADAITMHRHYDPSRPKSEMLAIIASVAGSQLDPIVVSVFTGLVEENKIEFE